MSARIVAGTVAGCLFVPTVTAVLVGLVAVWICLDRDCRPGAWLWAFSTWVAG